jgi:hypothetical protein
VDEVQIVDTTLRDGDIGLWWAYGMRTAMMLPTLRHMDEAGFDSKEFFLSLRFKKSVRERIGMGNQLKITSGVWTPLVTKGDVPPPLETPVILCLPQGVGFH